MTTQLSTPVRPLAQEDLEHVLVNTRECWEEARGQSFFITGGTGFFGIWLLESFAYINDQLNLGAHATVLTRNPEAFAAKAPHLAGRKELQFVTGDVRTFAFPSGKFTHVIHAATSTTVSPGPAARLELMDEMITGTQRVLAFAEQAGVIQLLLTSSGAVYGPQPATVTHIPEAYAGGPDPVQPDSSYGIAKRMAEHLCVTHATAHGYAAKIARCFAFVGPHLPMDGRYAIGNFIRDALNQAPISVVGDGSAVRSYLYAADLAVWLWTILFHGHPARAYNVGSMRDLSIAGVAETVRAALKCAQPVRVGRAAVAGNPPSRYVPNVDLAQSQLGLRNSFTLAEAIQRTARWHAPVAPAMAS